MTNDIGNKSWWPSWCCCGNKQDEPKAKTQPTVLEVRVSGNIKVEMPTSDLATIKSTRHDYKHARFSSSEQISIAQALKETPLNRNKATQATT